MRNPIRVAGYHVLRMLGLYPFYVLRGWGYLRDNGWFRSLKEQRSVDAEGNPIPWVAYAALHFLEPRLTKDMSVFEYGCGYSTLWWAKRVRKVVSCEHDRAWYGKISSLAPPNAEVIYLEHEADGAYGRCAAEYGESFDIIVVDGVDRANCGRRSVETLTRSGVMIWDDAEQPAFAEGQALLSARGFKRLDIEGMKPLTSCGATTSIFYRSDNCLGI